MAVLFAALLAVAFVAGCACLEWQRQFWLRQLSDERHRYGLLEARSLRVNASLDAMDAAAHSLKASINPETREALMASGSPALHLLAARLDEFAEAT